MLELGGIGADRNDGVEEVLRIDRQRQIFVHALLGQRAVEPDIVVRADQDEVGSRARQTCAKASSCAKIVGRRRRASRRSADRGSDLPRIAGSPRRCRRRRSWARAFDRLAVGRATCSIAALAPRPSTKDVDVGPLDGAPPSGFLQRAVGAGGVGPARRRSGGDALVGAVLDRALFGPLSWRRCDRPDHAIGVGACRWARACAMPTMSAGSASMSPRLCWTEQPKAG